MRTSCWSWRKVIYSSGAQNRRRCTKLMFSFSCGCFGLCVAHFRGGDGVLFGYFDIYSVFCGPGMIEFFSLSL